MENIFSIYIDKTERQKAALSLIAFGVEVFKPAKFISQMDLLKDINAKLKIKLTQPNDRIIAEFIFEYLIDCIRCLIFFENYMKAELIIKDYCVHFIDKDNLPFKSLAKEQHSRPIKLEEILAIENFTINETDKIINHNAVKNKTIGIKELLCPEYKLHYDFDVAITSIIQKLNRYRNTLHFNYSIEFMLSDEFISDLEVMNNFVDKTIKRIITF